MIESTKNKLANIIGLERKIGSPFLKTLISEHRIPSRHKLILRRLSDNITNRKLFYYKNIYRRSILKTKPIECKPENNLEIHILTCIRDYLDAIWCIKTFSHFSGLSFNLFIHDDGTLTKRALINLKKHFPKSNIINRKDADKKIKHHLKQHKHSYKLRFNSWQSYKGIKTFDFFYFSKSSNILILDSDILFFKKIPEIVENIKAKKYFYLSDIKTHYTLNHHKLSQTLKKEIIPQINSGILYVPTEMYNLNTIEKLLTTCSKNKQQSFIEQTSKATLMSYSNYQFGKLNNNYRIFRHPEKNIPCYHFTYNTKRQNFYKIGLPRLHKNTSFITQFK